MTVMYANVSRRIGMLIPVLEAIAKEVSQPKP
jgi:hypothetical protein